MLQLELEDVGKQTHDTLLAAATKRPPADQTTHFQQQLKRPVNWLAKHERTGSGAIGRISNRLSGRDAINESVCSAPRKTIKFFVLAQFELEFFGQTISSLPLYLIIHADGRTDGRADVRTPICTPG